MLYDRLLHQVAGSHDIFVMGTNFSECTATEDSSLCRISRSHFLIHAQQYVCITGHFPSPDACCPRQSVFPGQMSLFSLVFSVASGFIASRAVSKEVLRYLHYFSAAYHGSPSSQSRWAYRRFRAFEEKMVMLL